MALVAIDDNTAPGAIEPADGDDIVFDAFFDPQINNVGEIAAQVSFDNADDRSNEATYRFDPGENGTLIVREGPPTDPYFGTEVPDTEGRTLYVEDVIDPRTIAFTQVEVNDLGDVVYESFTKEYVDGVNDNNLGSGLFIGGPDPRAVVVRGRDSGIAGLEQEGAGNIVDLDDNGRVVFTASLRAAPGGTEPEWWEDQALFVQTGSQTPTLILRESGHSFGGSDIRFLDAQLSNQGGIFYSILEEDTFFGPSKYGEAIYRWRNGALEDAPLVIEGQSAVGTSEGESVLFRRGSGGINDGLFFNDLGQVAFFGYVDDGSDENQAVFLTDQAGQLHLIAEVGDVVDLTGNGDLVKLIGFEWAELNRDDAGRSLLNDQGVLAFLAKFRGVNGESLEYNSAIFTAAIPEPGTAALATALALGFAATRRRRQA